MPDAVNPFLSEWGSSPVSGGVSLAELLRRPELTYARLAAVDPGRPALPGPVQNQVEITVKYEGYLRTEASRMERFRRMEEKRLPEDLDYASSVRSPSGGTAEAGADPAPLGRTGRAHLRSVTGGCLHIAGPSCRTRKGSGMSEPEHPKKTLSFHDRIASASEAVGVPLRPEEICRLERFAVLLRDANRNVNLTAITDDAGMGDPSFCRLAVHLPSAGAGTPLGRGRVVLRAGSGNRRRISRHSAPYCGRPGGPSAHAPAPDGFAGQTHTLSGGRH